MNEITHSGTVYEFRASANSGEVKLYVAMDGTKVVITDRNNKVLFDVSVSVVSQLRIYQMSI
ncbi:hypothetical protein [Bacteroides intestinalis]|uniref:hypothetical protein n=1 Tax=Bacteroides intestinalis TaxID=329854 RepID=UPI00189DC596|nr:hypothetical protein [Bacteroides intestinalis]